MQDELCPAARESDHPGAAHLMKVGQTDGPEGLKADEEDRICCTALWAVKRTGI